MGTERFGSVICCSTVEMRLGTITVVNLFPKGFSISAIFEFRAFVFLAMRSSSRPKWCTTEKSYAVPVSKTIRGSEALLREEPGKNEDPLQEQIKGVIFQPLT